MATDTMQDLDNPSNILELAIHSLVGLIAFVGTESFIADAALRFIGTLFTVGCSAVLAHIVKTYFIPSVEKKYKTWKKKK